MVVASRTSFGNCCCRSPQPSPWSSWPVWCRSTCGPHSTYSRGRRWSIRRWHCARSPWQIPAGCSTASRGSARCRPAVSPGRRRLLARPPSGWPRFQALMLAGWTATGATTILVQGSTWWISASPWSWFPSACSPSAASTACSRSLDRCQLATARVIVLAAIVGPVTGSHRRPTVGRTTPGSRGLRASSARDLSAGTRSMKVSGDRRLPCRAVPAYQGGSARLRVRQPAASASRSSRRRWRYRLGVRDDRVLSVGRLPLGLEHAHPSSYTLPSCYAALLSQRSPAVLASLERCYGEVHVDARAGTWYQAQTSCRSVADQASASAQPHGSNRGPEGPPTSSC